MNRIVIAVLALLIHIIPAAAHPDSAYYPIKNDPDPGEVIYGLATGYQYSGVHLVSVGLETRAGRLLQASQLVVASFTQVRVDGDLAVGQTLSAWLGNDVTVGLDLAYYSDFKHGGLVVRPTIGIEGRNYRLAYGYNYLGSTGINEMSRHNLTFSVRPVTILK